VFSHAGNISPHHDEMSSETPPSYNQLNYNDNLSRFFNSQPKTLTEKEVLSLQQTGAGYGFASDVEDREESRHSQALGQSW